MRTNIFLKISVVATLIILPAIVFAVNPPDDVQKQKIIKKAYGIQVPFIENIGQMGNTEVLFYANTFGGTLFVKKSGIITYNLPGKDKEGVVINEVFNGKKITGIAPSPTKVNYFKGNDKSTWKSNIPTYGSVSLGEIHKGINLTLKAYGNNVEKLFTVSPGVKPETIKVEVSGAKGLKVNDKGELEASTELGAVEFTKPVAYQETGDKRKYVEVAYAIDKGTSYSFNIGNYDKKRPLIIDPLLASTFIGGTAGDYGASIVVADKKVYIAGQTDSYDFPVTSGAYDENYNVGDHGLYDHDIFVSKFDENLTTLEASTFIGGNKEEGLTKKCMAFDGTYIYVAGLTSSSDFPTTAGAYDENHNGDRDAFVLKLSNNLMTLEASTFLGGTGMDWGRSIAINAGYVYVTGETRSSDFPTTAGAYDGSYNGGISDGFVSKLSNDLKTLNASTFIGGNGYDIPHSHYISPDGNYIYITGQTYSPDFPVTSGVYDGSYNGGTDGFISKLTNDLKTLSASTFIGTAGTDYGSSITLDGIGNVYVAGATNSSNFPTTPGTYKESLNGGTDVFISKLSNNLTSVIASTFLGGNDEDGCYSIALDESGNVYVNGLTKSSDFPATPGAYSKNNKGGNDAFISKLTGNLNTLSASTFLGGSNLDTSLDFALDGNYIYTTGETSSADFPVTSLVYDKNYNDGGMDGYVAKLDSDLSADVISRPVPDTGQTKCYDGTVEITCPQPGEAFYGQDGNYNINPHSYTDLGNGIVRDNVTGLQWVQNGNLIQTRDPGFDADGTAGDGAVTWQHALDYVAMLNSQNYLGHSDWRLPSAKELLTLADFSITSPGPTINTTFFPGTVASHYWSSTPYVNDTTGAWFVYFYYSSVNFNSKTSYSYVRAVRSGQSNNNFVDNGDGTVTDKSTGLMWQQTTTSNRTWEQALNYCENLILNNDGQWTSNTPNASGAKYSDWRLPNANELQSIVDYSRFSPTIGTTFFPGTAASYSSYYWSSTPYVNDTTIAWFVGFGYGNVGFGLKTDSNYVRAVRGGQCGPTVIDLSSFTVTPQASKVILKWSTEAEIENAGFNIYRSTSESGEYIKINYELIPAKGSPTQGESYEFTDNTVQNRKSYYFKLEDIDLNGKSTMHGPVSATPRLIYGIGK
jgi:hypothetical protein